MVTKKTYKIRKVALSNKRTKYRKRKKHQSKKKRTKTNKLSRGGAWRGSRTLPRHTLTDSMKQSKKSPAISTEKFKKAFIKAEEEEVYAARLAVEAEEPKSFMLVDLHGSYFDSNDISTEGHGAGLRDDIMTWFFARYTNSTPNIPLDKVLRVLFNHYEHWEQIFTGLKQMEIDYQKYYDNPKKCPIIEPDWMALDFIKRMSVPFQKAIVDGMDEGGNIRDIYKY